MIYKIIIGKNEIRIDEQEKKFFMDNQDKNKTPNPPPPVHKGGLGVPPVHEKPVSTPEPKRG